jgi:hypothetical protein
MWQLREELARGADVVYAKWFRDRATFFSRPVFRALLAVLVREGDPRAGLSRAGAALLELLDDNSPQSTKELRASSGLQGRAHEGTYARALKELWSRLLVVGVGEVDDGAFPSLNLSATRHRFEDLLPGTPAARDTAAEDARALEAALAEGPLFARHLDKTLAAVRASKREGRAG